MAGPRTRFFGWCEQSKPSAHGKISHTGSLTGQRNLGCVTHQVELGSMLEHVLEQDGGTGRGRQAETKQAEQGRRARRTASADTSPEHRLGVRTGVALPALGAFLPWAVSA
jgi:hypothetical protein